MQGYPFSACAPTATPNPAPVPTGATAPNRVPYAFTATPKFLPDLMKARKLKPIDGQVLDVLLSFRKRVLGSCWCSKRTIAGKLGISPRSVQRSLDRLGQAGLLEQRPVASPDPDEPQNRTGWRLVFVWIMGPDYVPGPGPIRAGKGVRRPTGGETKLSPPINVSLETPVSPPPETPVSPNYAGASKLVLDGLELDGTTPSSSSDSRDDDDVLVSPPGKSDPIPEALAPEPLPAGALESIALAERWPELGQGVADKIRTETANIDRRIESQWDWFLVALAVVVIRNQAVRRGERRRRIDSPIPYAITTVTDWRAKGGMDIEGREAEATLKNSPSAQAAAAAAAAPGTNPLPLDGPERDRRLHLLEDAISTDQPLNYGARMQLYKLGIGMQWIPMPGTAWTPERYQAVAAKLGIGDAHKPMDADDREYVELIRAAEARKAAAAVGS